MKFKIEIIIDEWQLKELIEGKLKGIGLMALRGRGIQAIKEEKQNEKPKNH